MAHSEAPAAGGGMAAAAVPAAAAQPEPASASERFKDEGNAEYKAGRHLKAAALYTQGIKADPSSAVLYSNRSAALLQLAKTSKALADAEECIRLAPGWDKGHFRKASALEALSRMDEALQCYQAALERNKDSKQLAEKVRVLQKIVQRQKRGGAAASNAGSSAAAS